MNFILGISNEVKWNVKVVLLEVSLINLILRISNEIKGKMKVVFLEVSLIKFILPISKDNQMVGEGRVARSIIEELHS